MALTVHVLKDPRAGFKQKRYMERRLFIGNHSTGGGVRVFLDSNDVLLTYLPLFLAFILMWLIKSSQIRKISKDYIDQMKKANQVPLEMPLEELRSYALLYAPCYS
jgi:hypothetical protein